MSDLDVKQLQELVEQGKTLLEKLWPLVNDAARKLATAKGEEAAKTVNSLEDALKAFGELK